MQADIIILFEKGIPTKQFIVEDEITAESQFDLLAEETIGSDYDDVVISVDYGRRYAEANIYLRPLGKEIVWLTQIEVNQHKPD